MTSPQTTTEILFSKVAGISFYNAPFDEMKTGDKLALKREPENPYDENAIAIHHNDRMIGHINRELAMSLAPLIDENNASITCYVDELTGVGESKKGCNIRLAIEYDDLEYMKKFIRS